MNGLLHARFRVPLWAALAAVACWMLVPGTVIDRAAFTFVMRVFANPPFFISGEGTVARPWRVRTFSAKPTPDPRRAPLVVSLGDDPEGVFQSSPPSPVDLAVILSNLRRLGAKRAAVAAVLAWDSPDPIGLAALDKEIGRFDSLVMAAPLTRGAAAAAMPQAFRKASLPLHQVHGDIASLPVVNRIPLPGVILGRDNTLAGFQTLDTEQAAGFVPMFARWEDRVVLAFPLLAVMQALDLPLAGLEIRLGKYLKLGPRGPVVPIDRFGRLAVPRIRVQPKVGIAAASLIDGEADLLTGAPDQPLVLRDDLSVTEPATRQFSDQLATVMAAIASDNGLASARAFQRLRGCREAILLALWVLALTGVSRLPSFPRGVGWFGLAGFCVVAQALAAAAEFWVPGLAALTALLAALVACCMQRKVGPGR